MAITEAFAGTEVVGATEWSCPRDASYAIGSPQTSAGVYQVFLDLNDMVAGDILRIRFYEKVQATDTQRCFSEIILREVQSCPNWVAPSMVLMNGWDVSLLCIAGTSITVNWSIRKVA